MAGLPRIVTLRDFDIVMTGDDSSELVMELRPKPIATAMELMMDRSLRSIVICAVLACSVPAAHPY